MIHRRKPRFRLGRQARSFTLVELVVCISVSVVISGISGSLILNAASQRAEIADRAELYDIASTAMELVVRRIREIPQDECPANPAPCLMGHAQIDTATAIMLAFDQFGIRLDAGVVQITSDAGASWHPLTPAQAMLTLSYFDRSGSPLASFPLSSTDRENVRRIVISLELSRGAQTARLRTGIYLRSFMDEVQTAP